MSKHEKVLIAYYLAHFAGLDSGLGTRLVIAYYKAGSAKCGELHEHARRLSKELRSTKVPYTP